MSNAQTFSFDSVGDSLPTLREHEKSSRDVVEIKFGPALPLRLSAAKDELFVMNKDLQSATADNMKNILLTNRGERVMQPQFGANLKGILAEFGMPGFEAEVMTRIKTSVARYLPYVALSQMKIDQLPAPAGSGLSIISISISYTIPAAGIPMQNISVTMSTVV